MEQRRHLAYITVADLIVRSAYQMGKTPLLPIFAATLGASDIFLGLIVGVSTLTGMALKPLVGTLSDRWGRRIWLLIGTAFFAFMPFVYGFVQTPEQLFIVRLIHGMATAIYGPVTVAYVAEHAPHSRRAGNLGIFSLARSAGYIIGPAVAGILLLVMDPARVFTMIGLLSCLAFIPVLLLPKPPTPAKRKTRPSLKTQLFEALRSSGRTPAVWVAGSLEATNYVALYAIKAFLPVYALSAGMSIVSVGFFFSVQEGTQMLLKPLGGRFGDRWGHLWTICVGMALLGICLPGLPFAESVTGMLFLAIIMGAAQALIFPSTVALVATQIDQQHLGTGMGLIGSLNNAGKVIGPILGGLLIGWLGYSYTLTILGGTLLVIASIVLLNARLPESFKPKRIATRN